MFPRLAVMAGVWPASVAAGAPPRPSTWLLLGLVVVLAAALLVAAYRRRAKEIEARSAALEKEMRERQAVQAAAMRGEHQLRLMADALPVVIAYVDAGLRVRFVNLAGEEWSGQPRGEIEGRAVDEILTKEAFETVREPVEAVLSGTRAAFEQDLGEPDARQRIAVTLLPHADAGGRVLGFYGLAQDITDRVRTQEELHRRQDEIAHASRVSTLGEMASALAHELNQPLTAVLANAHAALRRHAGTGDTLLDADVEETLRDIAQDAARAGEIVSRLRDFIRKGASRKTPLQINEAILAVERLLHAVALESSVDLTLDLSPDLPVAVGDTIQVQQVVLNIVRNGIEAVGSLPRDERRIAVRSRQEHDAIVVTVEDSGPALHRDVLEQMFVPFYTTKANGLGMGLSISRSIIQAHGGAIEAEPCGARGLRVRFTLPVEREGALAGTRATAGMENR